ncbi:hypothetical protein [Priestia megaterium]|uniref:hypothetical protein n=1 Tax=Priestia megaterium TaxID=1404 RepID=UPI002D80A4F7|nr:hypothetical protein [Priestia megaterium]MEB4858343.1 hypothetical protein [Priestia megaterium]
MKIQPEKFYEACITHHLVTHFEMILDKKIYPFSISQIEEKNEGYDFGYKISNKSFFIQYKRPYISLPQGVYNWKIELEQLTTINSKNYNINTYYALPAFGDSLGWYTALNNTFFINAINLENQIKKINFKREVKSTTINKEKIKLDSWKEIKHKFATTLNTALKEPLETNLKVEDIFDYIKGLNQYTKDTTWLYIVEE